MAKPGHWVKILREHDPICVECWIGENESRRQIGDCSELTDNQRHHGGVTGERFWCEVLYHRPDGSMIVRVDNDTMGPGVPRLNEIIVLPADEQILDEDWPLTQ